MMNRFLAGLVALFVTSGAQAQLTLTHVHGLAYSADGQQLMIPSHHGLATYRAGKWSKAPGPQHDYMGFAGSGNALYSSGHPAPGSGLVNPFGLIRSRDGGRSWERLGLQGETDFHLLAVGWESSAIFVWNPEPSSRMPEPGLHYTRDEGKSWTKAAGRGVRGRPISLAVHPRDPGLVALGTDAGVFESTDAGGNFQQIAPGPGTALLYDLDGKHLWYAGFDGQARLSRALLREGPVHSTIPVLRDDAVAYIAQNPRRRAEIAIATFERSVYLSPDRGRTWKRIADRGRTE
jgi:hypothetical protein